MAYSMPINFVVLIAALVFFVYIIGIHNFLTKIDDNVCEMTYMFEYPSFVDIPLHQSLMKRYPRYGLYAYSEGRHTEAVRKMSFKGIPVLFIPGSSGSYKQGRSLASISLRKWINSRSAFHFDYFLVGFNEEHSGIYGGVLEDQTDFVEYCVNKILSLYHGSQKPSIVLVGHSMGGLVAKGLLSKPTFNTQLVNLIITLATPHKRPVLFADPYMFDYYTKVEKYWTQERIIEPGGRNGNLSHITMISIGGGNRDQIVRSDLIFYKFNDISTLSSSIPSVWCSTDHLSIVWCKQLVLALVRAMFDSVDPTTKQITTNKALRQDVFKYHLLKKSFGRKYSGSQHPRFATFDTSGNWLEYLQRQFTVLELKGLKINHFVMIRLLTDSKHQMVALEAINVELKDWLFVCRADYVHQSVRMCESGENISNLTQISPAGKYKRKFVYVNLHRMKAKNFTHVVFRLPPSSEYMQVNVDVHKGSDRLIEYQVPKLYKWSPEVMVESTADNAVYYTVTLNNFDSLWQAFTIQLETLTCKAVAKHSVISLIVPWSSEETHSYLLDKTSHSFVIKLTTAKPSNTSSARVRFILDPSCKHRISIQPSWSSAVGQFARYYTPLLPAYMVTVLLLTLRRQVQVLNTDGECVLFHSALSTAVRPYYVIVQVSIFGSKMLGLGILLKVLPIPDFYLLQDANQDFFFLPLLLYFVALVIVYSIGLVCYGSVLIWGQAAHKIAFKFLTRALTGIVSWSEWVMTILHQLPFVASSLLLALSISTCGGLALWVGTALYFLKLCKMYEEYLEELVKISIKYVANKFKRKSKTEEETKTNETENKSVDKEETEDKQETNEPKDNEPLNQKDENEIENVPQKIEEKKPSSLSAIHFHVTMFMLWLLTSLVTVPSVLVWAKGFHFSVALEKDPAFLPSIVFTICGSILWQSGVPRSKPEQTQITSSLLFTCAALSVIYGSIHMYRLLYATSAAVAVVTCHQLAAKFYEFANK